MTDERAAGGNTGHGHVWERPDGMKATCGGPALCRECMGDLAALASADAALSQPAPPDSPFVHCNLCGENFTDYPHICKQPPPPAQVKWHFEFTISASLPDGRIVGNRYVGPPTASVAPLEGMRRRVENMFMVIQKEISK